MTILLVGGGSGGHITPLVAVASQIKQAHPKFNVAVISEKLGQFNHLFDNAEGIDSLYMINAGKFRRYHGRNAREQLLDYKSALLNLRDVFKLALGTVQSLILLAKIRPNVILVKGGYVCVPVGFASRLLRIPYVTHDSDAIPGLTNRLIAKKAKYNAVGMPKEFYNYPENKKVYVGVPVTNDFINAPAELRTSKRKELDVGRSDFLMLITGGSNGAKRLDEVIHGCLEDLLEKNPNLNIVHQVGKDHENLYKDYPVHLHARIRVASFLQPLSAYMAAADLVITRAGATAIAEVGHMRLPVIIVPNPYLTGGHQIKNAEVLEHKGCAVVVNEHEALSNPKILANKVQELINSEEKRHKIQKNLHAMTEKDSTQKITELLIKAAEKK